MENIFWHNLTIVLAYFILSAGSAIHILTRKEDIKSSIGWIALVFLSPFIGVILYIFFGTNRVKRKGIKLKKKTPLSGTVLKKETGLLFEDQFITYGYNVYPQKFTFGNSVKPLQNGTQAYPEMAEAVKNAKKEVLVESYIFDNDSETDKLIDAFKTAIANGACVKVLIDAVGTFRIFKKSIKKKLSKIKGLEYEVFLPFHFPSTFSLFNLRNHRKIMLIDSQIAFFGGMNLALANTLTDNTEKGIIDITFKVEGPVVEQIKHIFEDDWEFVKKKKFHSRACFTPGSENTKTGVPARIIPDGPGGENGKIELLVQGMINSASKKILIITPYFLPENNILTALEMAAMRGVNIEIIIPEKSDHKIIPWATEPNFLRLAAKGIKIYMTPPPFDHSKIFVADDEKVLVGSSNWDVRSFRLLFEADMEIISKDIAGQLTEIGEIKKKKAKHFDIKASKNLPFLKRLRNNACRLITPYY